MYKISYNGKLLSNNDVRGKHWRTTKTATDRLEKIFWGLILEANLPKFDCIEVRCRFNSRHDVDGPQYTRKIFVDQLVYCKKLPNDNKKHWRKTSMEYDPTLPHNTIVFEILPYESPFDD